MEKCYIDSVMKSFYPFINDDTELIDLVKLSENIEIFDEFDLDDENHIIIFQNDEKFVYCSFKKGS